MLQILFAFLGGILTIAAPCILPMLPIILGASVGQTNKQRPLLIVAGFVVSFAAASLLLSELVIHLGFSPDLIRHIAIAVLSILAVFMIWPKPFEILMSKLSPAINKASNMGQPQKGNMGALILGLVLGIVWTPCAGPILGAILTLVATQGTTAKAVGLIIAYALGAGLPMLIIAYGSQYITTKVRSIAAYSLRIQQVFGVLILLLVAAMYFQYDTIIENKLTAFFPQSGLEDRLTTNNQLITNNSTTEQRADESANYSQKTIMEKIKFEDFGKAPEFSGISNWLNSKPLTLKDLKGKVVLIDFWTYSCINCIRTLPYVTKWYDTYKDKGFVVIGVHTPEFAFEKVTSNVETAIKRFNINYPVAQDNDFATWNAYNNQYWPAEYLIDQNGEIVYEHFGEGNYDHTENAIRQLLGVDQPTNNNNNHNDNLNKVGSPEMYFELPRLQNLSPEQKPSLNDFSYQLPLKLPLNTFALEGLWKFDNEKAISAGPGKIRLHFKSGKLFMVAASEKEMTVKIKVDDKPQPNVKIQMSQLYPLFDSQDYSEHTIDIEIPDAGFEAFTFTFG